MTHLLSCLVLTFCPTLCKPPHPTLGDRQAHDISEAPAHQLLRPEGDALRLRAAKHARALDFHRVLAEAQNLLEAPSAVEGLLVAVSLRIPRVQVEGDLRWMARFREDEKGSAPAVSESAALAFTFWQGGSADLLNRVNHFIKLDRSRYGSHSQVTIMYHKN
jgi:hypothetical protein